MTGIVFIHRSCGSLRYTSTRSRPSLLRGSGRRGFTLIEIMAVVVIMAIFATAAVVTLGGTLAGARMQDAVYRVKHFDATSRSFAQKFARPTEMVYDLTGGRFYRAKTDDRSDVSAAGRMPQRIAIDRVLVGRDSYPSGEAVVACSSDGRTPSYAVLLKGAGRERWLVFSGISGYVTETEDESEVLDMFDLLRRPKAGAAGDDAD